MSSHRPENFQSQEIDQLNLNEQAENLNKEPKLTESEIKEIQDISSRLSEEQKVFLDKAIAVLSINIDSIEELRLFRVIDSLPSKYCFYLLSLNDQDFKNELQFWQVNHSRSLDLDHKTVKAVFEGYPGLENFNYELAEELGLEFNIIRSDHEAYNLIKEVMEEKINISTKEGRRVFIERWKKECPDLPIPCVPEQNNFWALEWLSETYYEEIGPLNFNFNQNKVVIIDNWREQVAETLKEELFYESKILNRLFVDNCPVNISRVGIDRALWLRGEGIINYRQQTDRHKQILEQLGLDPQEFEIRLIRHDECITLAKDKKWGQPNLLTHLDGYYTDFDMDRYGLTGWLSKDAKDIKIYTESLSDETDHPVVQLVISRKSK